jgi:hypothetical protein
MVKMRIGMSFDWPFGEGTDDLRCGKLRQGSMKKQTPARIAHSKDKPASGQTTTIAVGSEAM